MFTQTSHMPVVSHTLQRSSLFTANISNEIIIWHSDRTFSYNCRKLWSSGSLLDWQPLVHMVRSLLQAKLDSSFASAKELSSVSVALYCAKLWHLKDWSIHPSIYNSSIHPSIHILIQPSIHPYMQFESNQLQYYTLL